MHWNDFNSLYLLSFSIVNNGTKLDPNSNKLSFKDPIIMILLKIICEDLSSQLNICYSTN